MSLDFKLHYDRLREGDPTKPEAADETNEGCTFYDMPGHARNLCLVWLDGKRQFLSYAYLIGGQFTPGGEVNEITLNFSAYIVILKGHSLNLLFNALVEHLPKMVTQTEGRYTQASEIESSVVTHIEVKPT